MMLEKLKNAFNHPYAAPLAEPLKSIARWGYTPLKDFAPSVKAAMQSKEDRPLYSRVFRVLTRKDRSGYCPSIETEMMTEIGGFLGAAGGIIGGIVLLHGLGWLGIAGGIIAGASIGMAAGPFVVAAAAAVVGAAAATVVKTVPSILDGLRIANKHRKGLSVQATAAKAAPQLKAAPPDVQQQAGELLRTIRKMPSGVQEPLLKALNEQYRGVSAPGVDGFVKAAEAMSESERRVLVKSLQAKLKGTFDDVARQEADAAMALHSSVKTAGPLKFKSPGASA